MASLPSLAESGASYLLTVRSERPVEGCELSPNAFLQLKGGVMDNSTRAKLLDSKPFEYRFRWFRAPRARICAGPSCPRGDSFDPVHWSKASLGGPGLLCNVCLTAGRPAHDVAFCSVSCFKNSWSVHVLEHAKLKPPPPRKGSDPNEDEDRGEKPRAPSGSMESWDWPQISSSKEYVPCEADVGCRLRVEVRAVAVADGAVLAGPVGIFTEATLQAPLAPPKRALIAVPGASAGTAGSARFRIISYNILAELYATRQAYPYCDSWSLLWPYRRRILMRELEEAQGDIVCLQEVQADHYDAHLKPFMDSLGYEGLYKQKSRDFVGQYSKVDGCATFWRRSRFAMTQEFSIEFNDLARHEVANLGVDEAEARRFMNRLSRDNIAQIVVLEALPLPGQPPRPRNQRQSLCISNTHLYSNHQRADVKLWQTLNLLRELRNFVVPRDLPLMICGDFNSEPDSAVYEFLMNGMIGSNHPELDDTVGVRILPDLQHIGHDLELTSALSSALGMEPTFTNYTAKFKGTLDYICYSPSRLRVLSTLDMPTEEALRYSCGEGLPAAAYPSDHLMICCDVAFFSSGSGSILNQNAQVSNRHDGMRMMRDNGR
mmetsp:Transcript_5062/g.11224  ORF Transcript_5062/g.11224 Transcript_5062/m.11224 type:complete len:602 (+) Transcript_5062:143-1948(+)